MSLKDHAWSFAGGAVAGGSVPLGGIALASGVAAGGLGVVWGVGGAAAAGVVGGSALAKAVRASTEVKPVTGCAGAATGFLAVFGLATGLSVLNPDPGQAAGRQAQLETPTITLQGDTCPPDGSKAAWQSQSVTLPIGCKFAPALK